MKRLIKQLILCIGIIVILNPSLYAAPPFIDLGNTKTNNKKFPYQIKNIDDFLVGEEGVGEVEFNFYLTNDSVGTSFGYALPNDAAEELTGLIKEYFTSEYPTWLEFQAPEDQNALLPNEHGQVQAHYHLKSFIGNEEIAIIEDVPVLIHRKYPCFSGKEVQSFEGEKFWPLDAIKDPFEYNGHRYTFSPSLKLFLKPPKIAEKAQVKLFQKLIRQHNELGFEDLQQIYARVFVNDAFAKDYDVTVEVIN